MKIKPMLIAGILAIGGHTCMAQALAPDVLTSAGECFVNPTYSLSWTLGEPITETTSATSSFLTQGFQQPTSIIVTNVNAQEQNDGNVSVFPNPFSSSVSLRNDNGGGVLQVELIDFSGKMVVKRTISQKEEQIDMTYYANGIYFLRVFNSDNQLIQTLKLDKIK